MKKSRIAWITLLAFCMALLLFSLPVSVFASSATDTSLTGTKLTTSHAGQTLSGDYYVEPGQTLTISASTGKSGLVVASGKTLTIHIPANSTLNVNGGAASGTTGAGAGIEVNSGSTLIITGEGKLNAKGGKAANGSKGGNGENANWVDDGYSYIPDGGYGGAGGGGAGAGIGTKGGNGGSGGNWTRGFNGGLTKETEKFVNINYSGPKGNNGSSGSSASACGNIYISADVTYSAIGGTAGTSGGSGGSRGSSDYESDNHWMRGMAGGAGGGGGGAGKSGANIGTGGGGGGGGGAGGGVGYAWSYRFLGAGGGGGGAGAVGGSGGAWAQDGEVPDCKQFQYFGGVERYSSSGSSGGTTSGGSGGVGAKVKITNWSGKSWEYPYAGNGGTGGSAGSNSTTKSVELLYDVTISIEGELIGTYLASATDFLPGSIEVPVKTGYTFEGFYAGDVQYYDVNGNRTDAKITADTNISAKFTVNSYGYNVSGSNGNSSGTLNYGEPITLTTPTRDGYLFRGWKISTTDGSPINQDAYYTYSPVTPMARMVRSSNQVSANFVHNGDIAMTAGAEKIGQSVTLYNLSANANAQINVEEVWVLDSFTVTFRDFDGTVIATQSGNYGAPLNVPNLPNNQNEYYNYTFKYWKCNIDGQNYTSEQLPFLGAFISDYENALGDKVYSGVTFTAVYDITEYKKELHFVGSLGNSNLDNGTLVLGSGDTNVDVITNFKITKNDGVASLLLMPQYDASAFTIKAISVNGQLIYNNYAAIDAISDANSSTLLEGFAVTVTGNDKTANDPIKILLDNLTPDNSTSDDVFIQIVYVMNEAIGGEYNFGFVTKTPTQTDNVTHGDRSEAYGTFDPNADDNTDAYKFNELKITVDSTAIKVVIRATGSITIAANQSFVYNGQNMSAADVSQNILNVLQYEYNGYHKKNDNTLTITWYDESGEMLDEAPKNAGTYYIGISAAETTYYSVVEEVIVEFTITQYEIHVNAGNQSFEYNGNNIVINGAASNAVLKDAQGNLISADSFVYSDLALTGVTLVDRYKNAGTYANAIQGVLSGSLDNYTIVYENGTLTITKAENDWVILPSNKTVEYSGAGVEIDGVTADFGTVKIEYLVGYEKNADGDYVLDANGERIPIWSETPPTNAGTYPVRVTVADNDNFEGLEYQVTLVITKKVISAEGFTFEAIDKIYNGQAQYWTLDPNDDKNTSDAEVKILASDANALILQYVKFAGMLHPVDCVNAGNHTIQAVISIANPNYTFKLNGEEIDTWTYDVVVKILKLNIVINANDQSADYTGSEPEVNQGQNYVTITLEDGTAAPDYIIRDLFATVRDSYVLATKYDANATYYKLSNGKYFVTKLTEEEYNNNLANSGSDRYVEYYIKVTLNPETLTLSKDAGVNAGVYALIATLGENSNYIVVTYTGKFTINKAKVAVPKIDCLIYNAESQKPAVPAEGQGIYRFVFADGEYKNYGLYFLTAQLIDPDNYEWENVVWIDSSVYANSNDIYVPYSNIGNIGAKGEGDATIIVSGSVLSTLKSYAYVNFPIWVGNQYKDSVISATSEDLILPWYIEKKVVILVVGDATQEYQYGVNSGDIVWGNAYWQSDEYAPIPNDNNTAIENIVYGLEATYPKVGTYTAVLLSNYTQFNSNYDVRFVGGSVTIIKKVLTQDDLKNNIASQFKYYTGSKLVLVKEDFTISLHKPGSTSDVFSVTNIVIGDDLKDANGYVGQNAFVYYDETNGKYYVQVTVALEDTDNYELGKGVNVTFDVEAYIAKAANSWTSGPSVDATRATKIEEIKHSAVALFGDEYLVKVYTDPNCQTLASGAIDENQEYYAKFTVVGNTNYDGLETIITFTGKQITIIKPVVRFDSETGEIVYAGNEITIVYDGKVHSFCVPTNDKYTVTVTGGEWKNVGTYTVTITLAATNCAWNDGSKGALVYTLNITKKDLTITADNKVITFGEAAPDYTVTADGLVSGETLESLLGDTLAGYIECLYAVGTNGNAGNYTIDILGAIRDALTNYDVTIEHGVLTVNKRVFDYNDITSSDNKTFGDLINNGPSYIYDSEGKEVIVGNLPDELEVTIVYKDKDGNVLTGKPTDAGEYTVEITVTVKDGYTPGNYVIPENAEIKLTIEKARITITIGNQEYDYTGNHHNSAIPSGNYTVTVNNGQELTNGVTLTVNGDYINVGVYPDVITATHSYATNNYIVTIENGTLTIKKVNNAWDTELNATQNIVYDKAPVTSGVDFFSDPKFGDSDIKYTFYEKVGETWVELSTAPTQAGEYAVVATVPGTNNYNELTSARVEFNIGKKTITIDGLQFADGIFVYNGDTHNIYVTGESSDVFAITYDNNGQINAGAYTVMATFVLADERNYVFDGEDTKTATLTINRALVTINAYNNTSMYGEVLNNLTYDITFDVAGDEGFYEEDFGAVVLSTSATRSSNVGTYDITISYTANNNYEVRVNDDAKYTITKFIGNEITLTASNVRYLMDLVYSASAKRGTVVFTFATSENGNYTSELPKNVGTYYVKATVVETDNYEGAVAIATFNIDKAKLSAISEKDIRYNADTATWIAVVTTEDGKRIDCNVTYLVDGTNLTVTSFKATKTGSFTVVAEPSDTANYESSAAVTLNTVYSVDFADKVTNHQKQQNLADLTGDAFATQYRFAGQTVTRPGSVPTIVGYKFRAWQLNDSDYGFSESVSANIVLYAAWTIETYKVKYFNEVETGSSVQNGIFVPGTITTELFAEFEVEYGAELPSPIGTPTKPSDSVYSYTFAYWSDRIGGSRYTGTVVTGDISLYAVYDKETGSITLVYKVSIDGAPYVIYKEVLVTSEYVLEMLADKPWFAEDTWYIDAERTQAFTTLPVQSMTLYGAYLFDIGAGDVNADGMIDTNDIINYRHWVVGGYDIVTVAAGDEWEVVTSSAYNPNTRYYLVRVSDANQDDSGDIRDITTIRMALTGGYGYDYVSGRDSAAGVTGEGVVLVRSAISKVETPDAFVAALEKGGHIQLEADIAFSEKITISKDTVIYLNGHELDASENAARPFEMASNAKLIIYGQDATIKTGNYGLVNIPVGVDNISVVLYGGNYEAETDNGSFIKPRGEGKISIELNDVTLTDSSDKGYAIDASSYTGGNLSIKVNGGTYNTWTGFVFDGPATNEFGLNNVTIIARYQGVTVGGGKDNSLEEAGCVTIHDCIIDVQVDLTKDDYSAEMGCITAGYGAQIEVTDSTLSSNIHIASICSGNGNSVIKLNNCTTYFDSETYEQYKFYDQGTIMVNGVEQAEEVQ